MYDAPRAGGWMSAIRTEQPGSTEPHSSTRDTASRIVSSFFVSSASVAGSAGTSGIVRIVTGTSMTWSLSPIGETGGKAGMGGGAPGGPVLDPPQSSQSLPSLHPSHVEPGPPSSHPPSRPYAVR